MQCEIILLCGTALAATIQFVVEIVLNVVIVAGVAALAGVGGAAYYFTRKRK